jgi:hypothetical protein
VTSYCTLLSEYRGIRSVTSVKVTRSQSIYCTLFPRSFHSFFTPLREIPMFTCLHSSTCTFSLFASCYCNFYKVHSFTVKSLLNLNSVSYIASYIASPSSQPFVSRVPSKRPALRQSSHFIVPCLARLSFHWRCFLDVDFGLPTSF